MAGLIPMTSKAVRFVTLDAVCRVLECQPGDVLRWVPDEDAATQRSGAVTARHSPDRRA